MGNTNTDNTYQSLDFIYPNLTLNVRVCSLM